MAAVGASAGPVTRKRPGAAAPATGARARGLRQVVDGDDGAAHQAVEQQEPGDALGAQKIAQRLGDGGVGVGQ
jgi:hypothetical protein